MSSVKAGEKPARRKRKVSYATFIGVGWSSAPKVRAKAIADGKLVNIPAPISSAMGGRIVEGCPGVGSPGS